MTVQSHLLDVLQLLPYDLWFHVSLWLPIKDLCVLRLTSKSLHHIFTNPIVWRAVLKDLVVIWQLKYTEELCRSSPEVIRRYCIRLAQIYLRWSSSGYTLRQVYEMDCGWADWTRLLPDGKHALTLVQDGALLLHTMDSTSPPVRSEFRLDAAIKQYHGNALEDGVLGVESYSTSPRTSLVVLNFDGYMPDGPPEEPGQSSVFSYDGERLQYMGAKHTQPDRATRYHFDGRTLWFCSSRTVDNHLHIALQRIYTIGQASEVPTLSIDTPISLTLVLPGYNDAELIVRWNFCSNHAVLVKYALRRENGPLAVEEDRWHTIMLFPLPTHAIDPDPSSRTPLSTPLYPELSLELPSELQTWKMLSVTGDYDPTKRGMRPLWYLPVWAFPVDDNGESVQGVEKILFIAPEDGEHGKLQLFVDHLRFFEKHKATRYEEDHETRDPLPEWRDQLRSVFGMRLSFRGVRDKTTGQRYSFLTHQLLTPAQHHRYFSGSEVAYMRLGRTFTSDSVSEYPVGILNLPVPETEVPFNFDFDELSGLIVVVTRNRVGYDGPSGHLRVFAIADAWTSAHI